MSLEDHGAEADSFLKSETASGRFRGAVLLARQGEVFLRNGYGLANEEWGVPNSPTTKFRIGSVTKLFTAAAVLRLVDARTVDLNGEIGNLLEDLPTAWQPMTIHQLLTHTAGLRDHLGVPAKRTFNRTGAQPRDLTNLISGDTLLFEPGTSHSYSNTGYLLLGMLIEKLTGRSYATYLNEELLRPSGLTATGYDFHSQILSERASGYILQNETLENAEFIDMSVPYSAGGLFSTVDDLRKWNTSLHREGVLSSSSYGRMVTPYPETRKNDFHYGYGIFIDRTSGYTCLSHGGGVNGFIAVLQCYPELDGLVIVLSNLFYPLGLQPLLRKLSSHVVHQ